MIKYTIEFKRVEENILFNINGKDTVAPAGTMVIIGAIEGDKERHMTAIFEDGKHDYDEFTARIRVSKEVVDAAMKKEYVK